jgi:RHS repeat-associated protein
MNRIHRKTTVKLLHILVVASLLLNTAPAVARAAPPHADPAEKVPAAAQDFEAIRATGYSPEPIAWQRFREPEMAESPTLQASDPYSYTVFLPFVAVDFDAGPQAEVALENRFEPWLALPGEVVTYTLAVRSTGQLAMRNGALVSRVPEQVEVLEVRGASYNAKSGELRRALGRLEPSQALTVTLWARVNDGSAMTVGVSGATFAAESVSEVPKPGVTAVATATLLVGEAVTGTLTPAGGELTSPDGRVHLVAPAGAVTETTEVRVADFPLPTWEPDEPRWLALFDVRAVGEAGRALLDGSGHTRFLQPLAVAMDLSARVKFMDAYLLHCEDLACQVLRPMPSEFDPATEVLTTTLQVFSGNGAAGQNPFPTDGSYFLFQDWPTTDLYGGGVSYRVPIKTPVGAGGLGPALALNYSSRSVDGTLGVVQSPDVGVGWSIGGVAQIVREIKTRQIPGRTRWEYKNDFTLMINGTSYKLKAGAIRSSEGRRYYTEERSGLRVMRYNKRLGYGNHDPNPPNRSKEYWVVTTPDGTEYQLGFMADSEQMILMENYRPDATCDYWHKFDCGSSGKASYAGEAKDRVPAVYRVDQVRDMHGNWVTYRYREEHRNLGRPDQYDRGVHLEWVRYSNGYRVQFTFDERRADGKPHDAGPPPDLRRAYAQWDEYRVNSIRVCVGPCVGVYIIREYVLKYKKVDLKWPGHEWDRRGSRVELTLLKGVEEYGRGGESVGASLPALEFDYDYFDQADNDLDETGGNSGGKLRYPRLVRVGNGYGGWVEFDYEQKKCDHVYSYRVRERRQGDGLAHTTRTKYAYGTACFADWRWPCVRSQPKNNTLWGHNWTKETIYSYSDSVAMQVVHYFHNHKDQALGREYRTTVKTSDGEALQRVYSTWNVVKNYRGISGRYLVELAETRACQYNDNNGSACRRTEYDYDKYGNVLAEYDHGDTEVSGDERTLRRTFVPNAAAWIVSLPTTEMMYAGTVEQDAPEQAKARQHFYYDGQEHGAEPQRGSLTRVDAWELGGPYTTAYEYDGWGNQTAVTDALGRRTEITYDTEYHQFPVRVCNALNQCSETEYYGVSPNTSVAMDGAHFGAVYREWGPNGESTATEYRYDPFGRVTGIVRPGDSWKYPTTIFAYHDGPGNGLLAGMWAVALQREESGKQSAIGTFVYHDGLGRLLQTRTEVEGGWSVASQKYDALGRVVRGYLPRLETVSRYTAPAGPYTGTKYDALGRVARVDNPDGTHTETHYDLWTTTAIDANRHQRVYTNDAFGRMVQVEEYTGTVEGGLNLYATTHYAYDLLDNLTTVSDTLGSVTTMTYDPLGRKIAMDDPDMGHWEYGYDALGNLIWQQDAREQRVGFTYDGLNRLVSKQITDSGQLLAVYEYDEGPWSIGQRSSMPYPGGGVIYRYDERGRVIEETRAFEDVGDYTTSYAYDAMDRVTRMTYPDGEVVAHTYDAGGLPATLSSSLGEEFVEGTTYNAAGQVTWMTLGNDLQTTYGYNSRTLRLKWMQTGTPDESGLHQWLEYDYDDVGNVTQIENKALVETQTFGYDALDRLISASAAVSSTQGYNRAYGYDAVGNLDWRVSEGTTVDYGYNGIGPHAVTDLSDGSRFEYDVNGNMTLRVEVSGTQSITSVQSFDVENQLVAVTTTNGTSQTVNRFGYDGDGVRVWQATEDGTTVYIGEYYEEFVPGLDAGSWTLLGGQAADNQGLLEDDQSRHATLGMQLSPQGTTTWDSQADFRRYAWPQPGIDTTSTPGSIKVVDLNDNFNSGTIDPEQWQVYKGQFSIRDDTLSAHGHSGENTIAFSDFYLQGDYILDVTIDVKPMWRDGESHAVYVWTSGGSCGQMGVVLSKGDDDLGWLFPFPKSIPGTGYTRRVATVRLQRVGGIYSAFVKNGSGYQPIYQAPPVCCTDDVRLRMSWQSSRYPDDNLNGWADNLVFRQGRYARASRWTSDAKDGGAGGYWNSLSFTGAFPRQGGNQSWSGWELRTGSNSQPDGSWTQWHSFGAASQSTTWDVPESLRYNRYAQVRVKLGPPPGRMVTPRVDSITLSGGNDTTPPDIFHGCESASGWNPDCTPNAIDSEVGVDAGEFHIDGELRGTLTGTYESVCDAYSLAEGYHDPRVRAWDKVGNEADQTWPGALRCDSVPPTGTITINAGAEWTNNLNATLTLSAIDPMPGSGVAEMRFCNSREGCAEGGAGWSSWEPYADTKSWTLYNDEGQRIVYVRYRDAAGNESGVYSDIIKLDTRPPVGTVSINGDAPATNSRDVALTLSASDDGSGVSKMRFRNDGGGWSAWKKYRTRKDWTLRDEDGTRTVYVRFRDLAGNVGTYMDTIKLDRMPPPLTVMQPDEGLVIGKLPLTIKGQSEISAALKARVLETGWQGLLWEELPTIDFAFSIGALAQGRNTLVFTATDQALNPTVVTRTVAYDPVGPAIADLTPQGPVADARPTIAATFSTTGTAVISPTSAVVRLDGRDVTTDATVTAADFTLVPADPLGELQHRVEVEVYDTAGNHVQAAWWFEVDLSTYVTITHPAGGLNQLHTTVEGEAEPGATVALQVNSNPAGSASADGESGRYAIADVTLSEGDNVLVVTATDDLGHTASATRTVTVDLAAPWADARAMPERFSPGGAIGFTTFVLTATAPVSESLAAWQFAISDGTSTITRTGGAGAPISLLVWDGQGQADGDYAYTLVVTATNGKAYAAEPRQVTIDLTPPNPPIITWPESGSTSDEGLIWVEGTAEPGTFITLRDGGFFTTTLDTPADASGRWAGEYPLHGGVNRIHAVADDTTGVTSLPSNEVVVVHVVHPPLYDVGTDPTTAAVNEVVTLWADMRGITPTLGAPTAAAWAVPPYGETVALSGTLSADEFWRWDGTWTVPAGVPSQETTVYFEAVDEDNLSGDGEIGLSIRNVPPEPAITGPPAYIYYVADPDMALWGRVRSAESLAIRVYDGYAGGDALVAQTRSVGWKPTVGVNWQVTATLAGEGSHPLSAEAESDFGLVSARGAARTLFLDTTPPTVTLAALLPYTDALGLDLTWQSGDSGGSGVMVHAVEHRFSPSTGQSGGPWSDWSSGGAGYTATSYGLYEEGAYGFRVRAEDRVAHVGWSDAQTVVADRTPPTVTLTLSEHGPYVHVNGHTAYYGVGGGDFAVAAALDDPLAGLAEVVFPEATSPGALVPLSGVTNTVESHAYTFTAASTFTGTAGVLATDRATNVTTATFTVVRDDTPPEVWLSVPRRAYSTTIPVTWGAADAQSGVAWYDLDVSVDGGEWQRVLTQTQSTSHQFTDLPGSYYTFRVTATDHVSNVASVAAKASLVVVTKYYYHGAARVAMRESTAKSSKVVYLHADHLGSTSLATDERGEVVSRQLYHPYGEIRWSEGTLPTDFTYTGQRAVPGSGLIFMHARYYHPALGRFVSADTIVPNPGNPQGLNRFAYVGNNPVLYRDPSGHKRRILHDYDEGGRQDPESLPPAVPRESLPPMSDSDYETYVEGSRHAYALYWSNPQKYVSNKLITDWAWMHYEFSAYAGSPDPAGQPIYVPSELGANEAANALVAMGGPVVVATAVLVGGGKALEAVGAKGIATGRALGGINAGVWQDSNGYWRNPDGTFAKNPNAVPKTLSDGSHANSLNSRKPNWLYKLVDRNTGNVMKYGITSEPNPMRRYGQAYYDAENVDLVPLAKGPRWYLYELEYQLNTTNNSPWSIHGH